MKRRVINKKKLAILIAIILVLLISIIIYLNTRIIEDNSGFTLKDVLNIEVYSDVQVKDFIDEIEGNIIEENKIDTSKLGIQEVSFIYLNNETKKRRGTFEIEIVDTEEPLVWISSSYSTPVGTELDLESEIICVDNYDNKPTCQVEGEYDINTAGTYLLSFVATDSSENTVKYEFNLIVYDNNDEEDNTEVVENDVTISEDIDTVEVTGTHFSDVYATYKTDNTEIGIDVSKYQGDIDFEKVKNAGATFVMIRVGYQLGVNGEYEIDPRFEENINMALKNNLDVGVYFYSYANSEKEAKKQAKWVIQRIKNYDISLPVVFDFESFNAFNEMELSIFGLNEVADSFINTLENAGYEGMLYGSKNYLNTIWKYHTKEVWLAHYTDETDYDGDYKMWQLCDDGLIDGIEGYVDIDILYK